MTTATATHPVLNPATTGATTSGVTIRAAAGSGTAVPAPPEHAGADAETAGFAVKCPVGGERGAVRRWRTAVAGLVGLLRGDAGMSTAEYAIGTIAAAAFASVLYTVVTGDTVTGALTSLIERALEESF